MTHAVCTRRAVRLPLAVCAAALVAAPFLLMAGAGPGGAAAGESAALDLTREQAIAALGDAPITAVYEAARPEVRLYDQHLTTLANPFFEGRAPGLRGNALAAEYVEFQFRRLGLEPAFPEEIVAADGTVVIDPKASFRQPFGVGATVTVKEAGAAVVSDGGETEFAHGSDFSVTQYSNSSGVMGEPVFVGYSIAEGEEGYSTYADVPADALKGRIAIVLRFEPMNGEGKSRWMSEGWSVAAGLVEKLRAAVEHGAAGIILVTAPEAKDERVGELLSAEGQRSWGGMGVPVFHFTPEAADRIVRAADAEGRSLDDLRRLADEKGGVVDLPRARVRLSAQLERNETMTDNVGAVLPGKGDLAGEFIVIGAHYDHVGYSGGMPGSTEGKVHPGADDNASGTSGLLLAAEMLKADYAALPAGASARSILFLAFSAEEMGLIGSRHFTRNPGIARDAMYLMLNMDMIGRLRSGVLEVGGTGTGEGLEEFLSPFLAESGLEIKPSTVGDGRSDHASFHRANVPALFFFTGIHMDYHKPGDVSWKINREGAVRIVELVREIALAAAQRTEQMPYVRPARAAERGDQPVAAPGQMRVRFGIQPGDYSGEEPGVLIGDVTEGTSAAEAGLRAGDRIIRWNGKELDTVESWMPMLFEHKPGDEVEIVFIRGGEEMTTTAKLKGRGTGG